VPDTQLYCGTSGFAYPSWKPSFYPATLPSGKFLSHYADRLNAVEINYTYRRIASAATFEKWVAATPPGFLFLPKAHMKITHSLKLAGAEEFTRFFLESLEPGFKADRERLANFTRLLPKDTRVAFEFRNTTWFDEDIYRVLRESNAALCLAENENLETPHVLTADFVYLRLRKPDYTQSELDSIAYRTGQYLANCYPTFAIFKHEETPAGALYAERLLNRQAVSGQTAIVSGS
jgi:uncharacterized protein YecE (DUF72 family)